jgi:hypothetical protein
MTRGTFVDGEATTIGVRANEYFRSTWYPPNGTSNAMFLEALRLLLIREQRDAKGVPTSLEIAWATPRSWLADDATIALERMPTSFGPVSYRITSCLQSGHVDAWAVLPPNIVTMQMHIRLPHDWTVAPGVEAPGWNPLTGTLTWNASTSGTQIRLPVRRSVSSA